MGFEYAIIEHIDVSEGNDQVPQAMMEVMAYCTAFTIKNGENKERPELQWKLSKIQVGYVEIVHEISRVSRSVKVLLTIVKSNKKGGVSPKSLNESRLDKSGENPMNEFLLNIFGSLA